MSNDLPFSWLKVRIKEATVEALLDHEVESLASNFSIRKEKLAEMVAARPKDKWQAFLATAEPNDELWSYSSPEQTWQNLCGVAGYALVRNGAIIASVATLRN